jgi:hypothetical protein
MGLADALRTLCVRMKRSASIGAYAAALAAYALCTRGVGDKRTQGWQGWSGLRALACVDGAGGAYAGGAHA